MSQEVKVLNYMRANAGIGLTVKDIYRAGVLGDDALYTSTGRAVTNLKDKGQIVKTNVRKLEELGKVNTLFMFPR
jgi:hypothetical protein